MKLRDDKQGVVFEDSNIKLYFPSHSWNMKALFKNNKNISIITHSFGDMEKFIEQINNNNTGVIRIICDSSSVNEAMQFKNRVPKVQIKHKSGINAKIYLRSDGRVYVSSEDIGGASKIGVSVGFESTKAYQEYLARVFDPAWSSGIEIK